ncbi:MAG: hypothetical protein HFJ30_05510 [Clostridia bacterium]|jgi:hypothetical protein|nr:hypothetical protein [Clostridia bacterium]
MEMIDDMKKEFNTISQELVNIYQKIEDKSQVNMIKAKVNHIKFGKGIVVNFSNSFLEVEFKEVGIKKFKYPEVFINHFLTCDSIKINEQTIEVAKLCIERDNLESRILRIKSEINKIENEEIDKKSRKKYSSNISNCMVAVLTGESYTDDIELKLYYDNAKNGFSNYGYIGLYREKSIVAIGKIENIVKACYKDKRLYYESMLGFSVNENQKERIEKAIYNAEERHGWNNLKYEEHYYFLVENFINTDFVKSSEGALWGRKKFDLCEILNVDELPSIEEIASKLNNITWE